MQSGVLGAGSLNLRFNPGSLAQLADCGGDHDGAQKDDYPEHAGCCHCLLGAMCGSRLIIFKSWQHRSYLCSSRLRPCLAPKNQGQAQPLVQAECLGTTHGVDSGSSKPVTYRCLRNMQVAGQAVVQLLAFFGEAGVRQAKEVVARPSAEW